MDVAVLGVTAAAESVAARCVAAGHAVSLRAEDANAVVDAIESLERRVGEAAAAVDGTTGLEAAVENADVVVDATEGDVADRRALVADVEDAVGEDALITVADPRVSITAVAAGLRRPGRAIGVHVAPDDDARVVEVAVAEQTSADARDRGVAFVEGLDCTPLVVRDAPGFVVTRLDAALIAESIRLVESEVAGAETVDRALEGRRGHERGPLTLADELGLDAVLETLEELTDRLDGRFDPPGLLREKVAAGHLGRQSGEGFYVWEGGEPVRAADPDPVAAARDWPDDAPGGV